MDESRLRLELMRQGWSVRSESWFGGIRFEPGIGVVLNTGVPAEVLEELREWTAEATAWFANRVSDDRLGMPLRNALVRVPFPENLDAEAKDWLANAPFRSLKTFYPWTHTYSRWTVLVGVCWANPEFQALGDFLMREVFKELSQLDRHSPIDLDAWLANRLLAALGQGSD